MAPGMTYVRRVCPTRAAGSWMLAAAKRSKGGVGAEAVMKEGRRAAAEPRAVDVFLSHRGVDTKRSLAGLLYDRLVQMNMRPFLDNRSMEPGDKLYECIDAGIRECKVGVAIFSPRYCDSVFCLHELAKLVESEKKLIPVFFDVKPSELVVPDDAAHSPEDLSRYRKALQEAKHTVGLTFDSRNGNWPELVARTANVVAKCMNKTAKRNLVNLNRI